MRKAAYLLGSGMGCLGAILAGLALATFPQSGDPTASLMLIGTGALAVVLGFVVVFSR